MAKTDKKVRIFSALEVANICGVVNQTAINWIKNGYLKAFTTPGGQYRVYSEDLVDFLHSRGMRLPPELKEVLEQQKSIEVVLVVDDDEEFNNTLKQFLEKKYPDYTVEQAFDGFEAGKVLAESKPDMVLLDVDLPGIDGRKLCQKIKEDSPAVKPIVIAISGVTDADIESQMMEAGADAFLAKPLKMEELPQVIEQLAAQRTV